MGTKLGPELHWTAEGCGRSLVAGVVDRLTPVVRAGRVGLACRLPSPLTLGPFEAVFKFGAGAPCRVPPVAAAARAPSPATRGYERAAGERQRLGAYLVEDGSHVLRGTCLMH